MDSRGGVGVPAAVFGFRRYGKLVYFEVYRTLQHICN